MTLVGHRNGVLSSCVFNNSTIKIWQLKLWNDYIILPLSGCQNNVNL